MTTFGDQVFGLGGGEGLPYSHLLGPSGKVLFVAPFRTASTTSNKGSDANPGTLAYPLKTIARAYAMCTGSLGEIIYVLGYSNTSADITDDWSAEVVWAKNSVHLIGLTAQKWFSHRARINQLSTATAVSPLLQVTGNNCVFANIQIFQGVADATSLINTEVTGQRNLFDNVHFAGVGATLMVTAGAMCLKLTGAQENTFKNCTIGIDTPPTAWDQTVTNLTCATSATRNVFENCLFDSYISNAGFAHVTIGANGIDRSLWFKDCLFMAKSSNKAITQTSVFSIPAISQGAIVLQNSKCFSDGGATDWDSNNRGIMWNDSVAAAATAGGGILTNQ